MKGLAVVLMGALLSVGAEGLAQMGAPDGRPTPSLPGVAGPLAAKYGADAAKILKAAETDEDGYAALTYLCDHVGKRLSGTPQLNTAIEWGAELMRKAGLQNVKVQPVMVPKWVRGSESGAMIYPGAAGQITRPLHMLGTGDECGDAEGGDYSSGGVYYDVRCAGCDAGGADQREDCGLQSGMAWVWGEYAVQDVRGFACGGEGRGGDACTVGDGTGDADSAHGDAGV